MSQELSVNSGIQEEVDEASKVVLFSEPIIAPEIDSYGELLLLKETANEHICSVCSKRFSQKSSLIRHLKIHNNVKPFSCPTCGKTFGTRFNCERHKLQHSTSCPYVCDFPNCMRGFKSKYALEYHMKAHKNAKAYVCTIDGCNKSFITQSNLTKHLLTHSQEKPYQCPFCQNQYKRRNDMTRHVNKIHTTGVNPNPAQDSITVLVEENQKQREMIMLLLDQNKTLKEKLDCIINV